MRIDDILMQNEGLYDDCEIYLYKSDNDMGFDGRFLTNKAFSIDNFDYKAISFELMDESRYNETILADCDERADFELFYADKNAKVLCIKFDPFVK